MAGNQETGVVHLVTTSGVRPMMFLNVKIAGHLDARWSEWFEGLDMRRLEDGSTEIVGMVTDQAALYGMLQRAQDLGLKLLAVTVTPADGDEGVKDES